MGGYRYTDEEIDYIAEEYERGTPVQDIATAMRRTVNSVVSAARQRGIVHPNKTRRRIPRSELKKPPRPPRTPLQYDIVAGRVWKPKGSRLWSAFVGINWYYPGDPGHHGTIRGDGEGSSAAVAGKRAFEDAMRYIATWSRDNR